MPRIFTKYRAIGIAMFLAVGCIPNRPASDLVRLGDEIVVNGRLVHTGTRVVLWSDPGGFNAYPGGHFGARPPGQQIDQFVLHYDAIGSSRQCFDVLQKRGLSVHFLLDTDGTIYQTLDTNERAWHATKANDRSVGIEIANIGAYPLDQSSTLVQWYQLHPVRPVRPQLLSGQVQSKTLCMYDFTPQQYAALAHLTSALCDALPAIRCDYPRDSQGRLIDHVLSDQQFASFHGILGHYHVQLNKEDPGPAMQWDWLIRAASTQ